MRRLLIIAVLLLLALSACGGGDDSNDDTNPNPTPADTSASAETTNDTPAPAADDTDNDTSAPVEAGPVAAMTATESAYLGLGDTISRAVAPDDQTLALGTGVGVLFYDLNDLTAAPRRVPILGAVTQVIYNPAGTHLAVRQSAPSRFNAPTDYVLVLDAATGETLASVDTFQDPVQSLHYSADGSLLVGEIQDEVIIWDALTLAEQQRLSIESEMGSVIATRISPDNTRLGLLHQNGMEVIEIATGAVTYAQQSESRMIEAYLEWLDNERIAHTALVGSALVITDLSNPAAEPVQVAQTSPRGGMELRGESLYITGAFDVGVYDSTGTTPYHRLDVGYATISPSAAVLVNRAGNSVFIYDAEGTEVGQIPAYAFDGLFSQNDGTLMLIDSETITHLDPTTPAVTTTLETGLRGGNAVPAITGDGAFAATVDRTDSAAQMTHILDTQTAASVSSFAYPFTAAEPMAFAADGSRLAIGGRDADGPVVSVWQDAALLWELHGDDPFYALAFTPDGTGLWIGTRTDITLYDAATGDPTPTTLDLDGESGTVRFVYAPSDTNRLVVLGNTSFWNGAFIGFYDATTYERIAFIPDAHHYEAVGAIFAGDTVLTVGRETRLRQWSLATGELVAEGEVFNDALRGIASLSDDGTRFVTLSAHGVLQFWEWTAGE